MNRHGVVVVAALPQTVAAYPAFAADGPYALTNAHLFDGINERITENVTVLMRIIALIDNADTEFPVLYSAPSPV